MVCLISPTTHYQHQNTQNVKRFSSDCLATMNPTERGYGANGDGDDDDDNGDFCTAAADSGRRSADSRVGSGGSASTRLPLFSPLSANSATATFLTPPRHPARKQSSADAADAAYSHAQQLACEVSEKDEKTEEESRDAEVKMDKIERADKTDRADKGKGKSNKWGKSHSGYLTH
jgi:hypothetical protein